MEGMDTSGKSLVNFWTWASEKGEMNVNTAGSYRKSCRGILQLEEGWEGIDVRNIDIDAFCRRFQNKRSQDYKPDTLSLYINLFRKGIRIFLEYVENPASWKFQANRQQVSKNQKQSNEKVRTSQTDKVQNPIESYTAAHLPSSQSSLIEFPFPLREGRLAYLKLPTDLKMAEVKRLAAHLQTLAIDAN